MQADLSSKVFEMAYSLQLVMGLVGHIKQILASHSDSFPLCFFSRTMPLQTPDSKETAMRHLNGFVAYLTLDPRTTAKTFDTESIR